MKKILVTGANGYIGRHVIDALISTKLFDISVVTRSKAKFRSGVKVFVADILADDSITFSSMGEPDILLHLAWEKGFEHNSYSHMTNLSKHFSFITNLIQGGLAHVVVMGTMHEVGYWEGMINEMTPTNPLSLYAIAKNSLRQSLEVVCKDKKITLQWLRGFYVYGDDVKNHSIFTKILEMEKKGEKNFPFTSGANKYDFLHVKSLAYQIVSCVSQTEIDGIINCCSGNPISLKEKVEEFLKDNDLKIKPLYGMYPSRQYDSPALWGDNSKIKTILSQNKK